MEREAKRAVQPQQGSVHGLPAQPTTFIGRARELASITLLLNRHECRLLTLLGPGGIGKTRLALQVARRQAALYDHGVYFAPLQPVESRHDLVSSIADALALPLTGPTQLQTQLHNYLRGKEVLLLLDNFEQLLPAGGEAVVAELLAVAPELTLLVTSREVLGLQEEWVYSVPGLSLPLNEESGEPEESDAMQLFAERATRVRSDFSMAPERDDMIQICHLVDGVPLALELAATWTKMLACHDIVTELARNPDMLITSRGDVAARHRSMHAVFDQTWRHLSTQEQEVFTRLSVFRGGFQRLAAEEVAGASLSLLSVLQDKALLRWSHDNRYHIHELLRQYAFAKLAQSPRELERIRNLHCRTFAHYLAEREADLMGVRQVEVTQEIQSELENVRAAWKWAVQKGHVKEIKAAAFTLGNFYQYQSRYHEGLDVFELASARLEELAEAEEVQLALIDTLMVRSWFYLRFGRVADIEAVMEQSQAIHRRLGADPQPGYVTDPAIMLAFAALVRGNYPDAARHARQALRTAERQPERRGNREFAHYLLAQAALAEGQYERAQHQARAAHAIAVSMEDDWFRAYILNTLAELACVEEQHQVARQHYEASYAIREAFNDAEGMAVALSRLSAIALQQKRYVEARRFFCQSLELYENVDDTGGRATAHMGLGDTALAEHDLASAAQHYQQALALAAQISFTPVLLSLLSSLGELFCLVGQGERGLTLLNLVAEHPATKEDTKQQAKQAFARFRLQLHRDAVKSAEADAARMTLEAATQALLGELPLLEVTATAAARAVGDDPNQSLVEPLTDREMDVLRLLAEGLSNRQIADDLTIAEGTVKYYTRQIYGKLQVRNRVRAVSVAQELKLV